MQNLAAKNPSVAGCANEEFFITYLKQNVSLPVVVSSVTSVESQSVALSLGTCVPFKGANYIKGIMYELYIFHPVIDFVGYLDTNNSSCGFLVMLQLSLSRYADHQKKLSDVIRHAPKKSYLLQGETTAQNLLTHYSSRATDLFGPKNPSVLFLYASPKEDEKLIPVLKHEIKTNLNQYSPSFDFYVGVVDNSIFKSNECYYL